MKDPLTTELSTVFVVESWEPLRDWRVYESCTSKTAALKSMRAAKKAWPKETWRIVPYVRVPV